jgi:type IV secretory pathway VirB10-like protein
MIPDVANCAKSSILRPTFIGGVNMETIRLTYRELAARLGKTPDAARVLAKRRAEKGEWKIIEGNHPQDAKYVELPADAVPPDPGPDAPPPPLKTKNPEILLEAVCEMLADQQEQVTKLTDLLVAAKDQLAAEQAAHRKTGEELAGTIMREMMLGTALDEEQARSKKIEAENDRLKKPWRMRRS